MDLSETPSVALAIVPELDRVFIYAAGHPPLVMTHDQIHQIWVKAARFRADTLAVLGVSHDRDGVITSPTD